MYQDNFLYTLRSNKNKNDDYIKKFFNRKFELNKFI